MLRKIIQLGDETLVVSLPSGWARQHNLRKGDELEAEEQGPKLVLYPKSELKQGRVVVDVSGTGPVTKRVVAALYKVGYDEVEILFGSQKELDVVEKTIRDEFVGFEIVSKTGNSIVARVVSQSIHEEFEILLRRVFSLILEMGNECFKVIDSGSLDGLQKVAEIDRDVNRYVNFCRRTLNVTGHKVTKRVAPTYYLVEQLERVGDCYKNLCAALSKSKSMPSTKLKDSLTDANFMVRKFYELYYKFSLLNLSEFWKEKEKVQGKIAEVLTSTREGELHPMFILSEIVNNVVDANGPLLTLKL
ncbi:phosphate uptake regulator PhoU [Candidatus Woesearchaeota archaeon]|nr:phosphate uptake regulator PhoU [Candidatus Woesearchaeota archaeon]